LRYNIFSIFLSNNNQVTDVYYIYTMYTIWTKIDTYVGARSCFKNHTKSVFKMFLSFLSKNDQVTIKYYIYTMYTIWTELNNNIVYSIL
jgi:hypothetical protein